MGLSLCHANRRRTEHMMASGRARGTNLGGRVRERERERATQPTTPKSNHRQTKNQQRHTCVLSNQPNPNPTQP